MTRVIYSDQAKASLRSIVLFISEHDVEAAVRLVDELQRRVDGLLTQFPKAGTRAASGRRFVTIRRYAVLYRHDPANDVVVVLDVFGPRVDWR